MITIVEPTCMGLEHAAFNAAVVEVAGRLAMGAPIAFYGHHSHITCVREIVGSNVPNKINWRVISLPERHERGYAKRFYLELSLFRAVLRESADSRLLIVTSALETSLPALTLQRIASRFRPRVNVIFHASLSQFLYSRKRRAMLSFAANGNIAFLVLGQHIRDGLVRIMPALDDRVFSIQHPYPFDTTEIASSHCEEQPVFGFVGAASKSKGFDTFLEIIGTIDFSKNNRSPPKFKLVGRVSGDCIEILQKFIRSDRFALLEVPRTSGSLSHKEYELALGGIDYFVMPYDPDYYEFVSSGAAMDAVKFAKPIVALRSKYFDYLFGLCGDIGYLCNDVDQMKQVIERLSCVNDIARYNVQRANLLTARRHFTPAAVAEQIAKVNGIALPSDSLA